MEDTCIRNHRGQNPILRTAMWYLLAGLLLYFLVALAWENNVRTWNLEFSLSVKSQGKYLTFSNPKYFQAHKALVNFLAFRGTDPILHFVLRHYSTEMGLPHTPLDLTTGLFKCLQDTLHLKGSALIQQHIPRCLNISKKVCVLLNTS